MKFQKKKKKILEVLGNTFNLHSNSTNAQEVWSLNQLYEFVQGKIRECPTLTYKPFHVYFSNSVCFVINKVALLLSKMMVT